MWRDSYGLAEVDLRAEHPNKFLQHQPRVNGDIPALEGLSRLLVWSATFRNWDVADWMQLAEMSWKPWRIGKYSKQAGEPDIDNLIEALRKLTTNGIAAIREDHNLEIKWPEGVGAGTKGNHQALAEWLGAEMSKAILGQTLTTEQGERGARSLGEVHDRVRKDLREADARAVMATLMRCLIVPLVALNFGPAAHLPIVGFQTDDAVDLSSFAEGVGRLASAGTQIPQKWVRDRAGITEPEAGDVLLGGKPIAELPEPTFEPDEDDPGDDDDDETPEEEA